jgi:hypothetical protein
VLLHNLNQSPHREIHFIHPSTMSPPTQLVVLPGTRQTALGPLPSFVKPVSDPPEPDLQRAIKAVLNAKKVAVVVGTHLRTLSFRSLKGTLIAPSLTLTQPPTFCIPFILLSAMFDRRRYIHGCQHS